MSVRGSESASPSPRRRGARRAPLEVAPPRLPFDVAEAKIRVPALRADSVSRTALVNRLRAASVPVVTCISPAGYGKTTLIAQWASRDPRPFAWVSVDERDDDPRLLLQSIGAALDRIEPLPELVLRALRTPGDTIWRRAVPRLASAIAMFAKPFVLVLDDIDLVDGESAKAVATLIDHVPEGSAIVVTGRVRPRLPVARLRARGLVVEIDTADLALNKREITVLLQSAHLDLDEADIGELTRRTEGWAVGVSLATLAFEHGRDAHSAAALRGDDRYLSEYFELEYLGDLTPRQLAFLRRTSVLECLSGPLCDAVLDRSGSARELASIDRSNLFLVPLDDHGEWYRYHHLFRELLQRELAEREPQLTRDLNRRAADWFEANGRMEEALRHACVYGHVERAGRILALIAMRAYDSGRVEDVEGWLARFDNDELLERLPGVAVHGSRVHALRGRADEADRWLAAAERRLARGARVRGSAAVAGAVSVVRAWLFRDGADQMRVDAERAIAMLPPASGWQPSAVLLRAIALALAGDDGADAALANAAQLAARRGSIETLVLALTERAVLAAENGEPAADEYAAAAEELVAEHGLEGYAANALRLAASARAKLRAGRWQHARADLEEAERLLPVLAAIPWLAAQTRLELAGVHLATREGAEARALLADAGSLVGTRGAQTLARDLAALETEMHDVGDPPAGRSSGLTDAELRLLPMLATHLSFREIGERLFVSRNTIKTQAISVYRKLHVSSRSEAVDSAIELGLLAGAPGRPAATPLDA